MNYEFLKNINPYKFMNLDKYERIIVVPDLHGSYSHLCAALEYLKFNENDFIISLGDLIDRGDNSFECLSFFLNITNCFTIVGNHEVVAYAASNFNIPYAKSQWLFNENKWVDKHNEFLIKKMFEKYINKSSLILKVEFNNKKYGFAHAEIPNENIELCNVDFSKMSIDDIENFNNSATENHKSFKKDNDVFGVDLAFFGHKKMKDIYFTGNKVYMDTAVENDLGFNDGSFLSICEINRSGVFYHKFKKNEFNKNEILKKDD